MRRTLTCIASAAALALPLAACGSSDSADPGSSASGCDTPTSDLTVEGLDRLAFDADTYRTAAGCIEVRYTNAGTVPHTLLVQGQKGFKLSIGRSDTGAIELPAGTYRLYCDLPGHEAAGMHAELTVT